MKGDYPIKPIGELCDIIGGGTPSKSNAAFFNGDIPWATVRDMSSDWIETTEHSITPYAVKQSATHILPSGTVVVASRVGLGKVCRVRYDTAINQDLRGFIPKSKAMLDTEYLFWWFKSVADQIVAAGKGATVQGVTLPFLRSLKIPLPPLDEQRRIVAVLDKAFAAIATSSANAQTNLTNARALFESYQDSIFSAKNGEWRKTELGQICKFENGDRGSNYPHRSEYVSSGVPWINTGHIQSDGTLSRSTMNFITTEKFYSLRSGKICSGDLVYCLRGATLGKTALVTPYSTGAVASSLVIIRPKESLSSRFLYYFLTSPFGQSLKGQYENGAAQPNLGAKNVAKFRIAVPDLAEQDLLVGKLDSLRKKTLSLAQLHDSKLAALAELKQSLLHKAFAGELTAAAAQTANPAANDNFATPQFTAQVLAFAHHRHELKQKQRTFGHVKAQKTLHLVESVGGVELGRRPIRDAAGPNDMQHMLRATDWAVQQGFFEFVPRANGKGYDFKKLANYDACWAEAEAVIKPVANELTRAIDLIVDSPSDFAELIATTHAAWNNLIIDKAAITDDAIVLAARDNWHDSKLKFDPSRFHDAIRFIRTNGIIPDGSATYVGGQVRLL